MINLLLRSGELLAPPKPGEQLSSHDRSEQHAALYKRKEPPADLAGMNRSAGWCGAFGVSRCATREAHGSTGIQQRTGTPRKHHELFVMAITSNILPPRN